VTDRTLCLPDEMDVDDECMNIYIYYRWLSMAPMKLYYT